MMLLVLREHYKMLCNVAILLLTNAIKNSPR